MSSLLPNAFGLYDVIGSVWEWCLDGFDEDFYSSSPAQDPLSPFTGPGLRVSRDGSFIFPAFPARSAQRIANTPSNAAALLGVRPARVIHHWLWTDRINQDRAAGRRTGQPPLHA